MRLHTFVGEDVSRLENSSIDVATGGCGNVVLNIL